MSCCALCPVIVAVLLLAHAANAARPALQDVTDGTMTGFALSEAAAQRRAGMHKHFQYIPKPSEDDGDDEAADQTFDDIKQSLLEAHVHDLHAKRMHLERMGRPAHEQQAEEGEAGSTDNKKKHKRHRHHPDPDPPMPDPDSPKFCYKKKYRKATMKVVKDAPFIGLFNDLMNITRFEGSSVTFAKDAYWVVFDSLRAIGKVGLQFQFRGAENRLIPEDAGEMESQFEGLQYMPVSDTFLAVRESVDHDTHGLIPLTEEIKIADDEKSWTLSRVCPVLFKGLEDPNKGWEGLHYYEKDGERYLMGLCESNYCKTIHGSDPPGLERGNGRVILTKLTKNDDPKHEDECHWEVVQEIKLPHEAYFLDYAGIAFYPDPFGSRVAVVSQEDAAVWVGEFDWEAMEFKPGGKVYHFPRNADCDKMFCNVEGLTWLDAHRLMFASDRSKSTQPFTCMGRDQSMHIMALP